MASGGQSNTSSQANSVNHFDHLIDQSVEAEKKQAVATASQNLLSREQFRQSFIGLHGMGAAVTGIKSIALPNSHVNEQTAEEVADTIYETILDVPMFHFILQPGNKWLGRAMVIAVYVQGMNMAVGTELAQRRTPRNAGDKKQAENSKQKSHDTGDLTPEQVAALTGG